MAVGSFDSQLGRRLQKIAFYCARYRYGFLNVPNIVIMRENGVRLVVEILSYPLDKGMTQHLYWSGHVVNYPSVSCKRAYVYEIKVGGNLDTKNKGENMNEVIRLEKYFLCLEIINQSLLLVIIIGVRAIPDGIILVC